MLCKGLESPLVSLYFAGKMEKSAGTLWTVQTYMELMYIWETELAWKSASMYVGCPLFWYSTLLNP